ncbi:MAG: hypothetical protein SAJ12_00545 [Jaaginema sp. PMC 1079.18]|nr:hypothetical protein [Jaaginema sp. PMC 1080.18]MEC4849471.1 hypothetical protein [Jaaginema sp. PMC 1079.18]MEC4866025.1 hypothetical protein [Jaaginema sp. PMC 1078.18]
MKPTSLSTLHALHNPSQALLQSTLPAKKSGWQPRSPWQKIRDWAYDWFIATREPKINIQRDRAGLVYWSVYDPVKGDRTRFTTEAEVRTWLEQRYYH